MNIQSRSKPTEHSGKQPLLSNHAKDQAAEVPETYSIKCKRRKCEVARTETSQQASFSPGPCQGYSNQTDLNPWIHNYNQEHSHTKPKAPLDIACFACMKVKTKQRNIVLKLNVHPSRYKHSNHRNRTVHGSALCPISKRYYQGPYEDRRIRRQDGREKCFKFLGTKSFPISIYT